MFSRFRHVLISAAGFLERYVLSLLYLWLAWRQLNLVLEWLTRTSGIANIGFVFLVRETILCLVQLFVGLLLLINQKPTQQPRELKEVLVPLATSLFFIAYTFVPVMPVWLRANLLPLPWQIPAAIAALFIGLAGACVAIAGVMHLGRSFGIFVSVREIVLRGPYRYVRHPIYLGYLLLWTGLVLSNFSPAIFILVAIHSSLLIYRATLEEKRLAESSPAYREHMRNTPFIFPRLG
jgi:protein-S-isoprenylcysteine O-methyltransferase Ste14